MEMTADLIAIQGLLTSVVKTTGDFTKIRHKGGNEMKINLVIKELEEYLESKRYMIKRKSNKEHEKELEQVTFFLTINSEFKCNVLPEVKEYSHLINTIPMLSKCLLSNIIVELDLCKHYCEVWHKLPSEFSEDLLYEFVPCLKRIGPEQQLDYTYIFLKNIILRLTTLDPSGIKVNDIIEKNEDIASEMLLNMSGMNPDQVQGWTKSRVYNHMGQTLLKLLKLLLLCEIDNYALAKLIDFLIKTICSVVKAVTINVYCSWAEIQNKGHALQTVISSEAYYVIEKFQKYKPATELIQMLGSIARKPKTLKEMIQEADITTIIAKIEECDSSQKYWFAALLNTQVFDNEDSINCITKWANLCTLDDINRLLSLSMSCKTGKTMTICNLVLRCASFLNELDIIVATRRFYHQHGIKSCLDTGTVETKLTTILNRLQQGENKNAKKEILLLLLENPEILVKCLYVECIKNGILLSCLIDIFKCIGDVIQIENLSIKTMECLMSDLKPNSSNVSNYEKLFAVFVDTTFSGNLLIRDLIQKYTDECLRGEHYEDLKYSLHLYNVVVNKVSYEEFSSLFTSTINILEQCRWKFFEYSNIKQDICEKCVEVALDYIRFCHSSDILPVQKRCLVVNDILNKYYITKLYDDANVNFFPYVCPNFSMETHAEGVCYLIKLLPVCVIKEWFYTCEYLCNTYGYEKFLDLITDALILICQLTKTQQHNTISCSTSALVYCIQNFGIVIKDTLICQKNLDIDVKVAKNICRLLKEIPEDIRKIEGMSLTTLFTDNSLKNLAQDKTFICHLIAIGDSNISQSIAKRML